jgi:hypothetical protein
VSNKGFLVAAACAAALLSGATERASAFVIESSFWQVPSIELRMQAGPSSIALNDGSVSYDASIENAVALWNEQLANFKINVTEFPVGTPAQFGDTDASGNRINTVTQSTTVYGDSFGSSTLAVTLIDNVGNGTIETDIIFNTSNPFDSYRGQRRFVNGALLGFDIHRIALHELGHALGLDHPDEHNQRVTAIMNAHVTDIDVLQADDIAGAQSLYGAATVPPAGPAKIQEISTRGQVGTGDAVMIGGFIIQGTAAKKVIVRAIGPSLGTKGVTGFLADPMLSLFDGAGTLVKSNDNWRETQEPEIIATTVPPADDLESAIVATLPPGNYTAIVQGKDAGAGLGLVEVYDLDPSSSRIANISTRARVGTGDDALIGGFIVGGPEINTVVIRAIGPSLGTGPAPVSGALANPTMEIRNGNGQLLDSNDDYTTSDNNSATYDNHLAPASFLESALSPGYAPGNYTVIVRGVGNTSGIALVEVYGVQ